MYIRGQFEKPAGGEHFPSLNPADGSLVARVAKGCPADVDKAVLAATKSQFEWAAMNPLDRGQILKRVAEAIQIANDTPFGLATGIWNGSLSRAHRVASKLEAGTVYVNTYHDPSTEAPAGAYKQSGIGRERGITALREYLQLKTVSISFI